MDSRKGSIQQLFLSTYNRHTTEYGGKVFYSRCKKWALKVPCTFGSSLFLSDRLIQTKINDTLSSKEVLEEGLPQGSSLSCTLFLVFLNDISDILKLEIALFADDLVIWHTGTSTIISRRRIQEDLDSLGVYCRLWKMKVNCTKTVYSVFIRSSKLANSSLSLSIDGISLTKEANPIYLGVQLDSKLNLKKHTENLKKKATARLNLIKKLASTDWGGS